MAKALTTKQIEALRWLVETCRGTVWMLPVVPMYPVMEDLFEAGLVGRQLPQFPQERTLFEALDPTCKTLLATVDSVTPGSDEAGLTAKWQAKYEEANQHGEANDNDYSRGYASALYWVLADLHDAANGPQYVEHNDRCSSTTSDRCGKCFGCVKREDLEQDARQERGDE